MVFQPELPPLYMWKCQPLPCLTFFLKGAYTVAGLGHQPLEVPNGLLAFTELDYNRLTPGLYIPGKDKKAHRKKRVRVRMEPLASLGKWRRHKIWERNRH